ncbi:hypothetical protein PIB30_095660 [Stylosanthes scabra]|uniref:Uncharacterized protein n=1 Tax=Stylosanthes scabra TaxID=79078 RepID=A0ABU6TWD3_9FABA|nr:hypothetical protein [Stylosanthes scabra]
MGIPHGDPPLESQFKLPSPAPSSSVDFYAIYKKIITFLVKHRYGLVACFVAKHVGQQKHGPSRKTHRGQLIIALECGTNVILGCWWSRLVLGRKHEVTFDELVRSRLGVLGHENEAVSRLSHVGPNVVHPRSFSASLFKGVFRHARYPELNANFELKSGLINLLPRYHELTGEDPIRILRWYVQQLGELVEMSLELWRLLFPFFLKGKQKIGLSPNDKALIDASSGSCLLVKTPEEARELIENIVDASQHFRTRSTASSSKGVFGVTPNKSLDLAKAMGDIASVLKDIREAGLVTQNINNTPTSSQPSSSSTLPSKPFPNAKGSINAISFHEDYLELEVVDDDEEEFLKMLEEISMNDDVGFEESEGIIKLGDGNQEDMPSMED